MQKISAVIITYNEENKIAACLASLQGVADEIIVMDSFSTDNTAAICKQYAVKFFQQPWAGYGQQKNDAAAKATHAYILSLDADEQLSDTLQKSINAVKREGMQGLYCFNRLNIFFGYTLRYGSTQPDKVTRIYDKRFVNWALRDVHETLEFPAGSQVQPLQGNLIHHSKDSIHDYIATINQYSTLSAQHYFKAGKKSGLIKIFFSPLFTFFQSYFLSRGFLDGMPGLIMAINMSLETFLKYSKLYVLQKSGGKTT